jgi:hypothetical protein
MGVKVQAVDQKVDSLRAEEETLDAKAVDGRLRLQILRTLIFIEPVSQLWTL